MDDYGTQDTSNVGDNYDNYSDGNYQGYTHQYDNIDKSNDVSSTTQQENKSSEALDQNNIVNNDTYASSTNDSDSGETSNKHSLTAESQETTPQNEKGNYKWLDQVDFIPGDSNPKDEYQSIINQEPKANEEKFRNDNVENTDDSDCCYCKSEPLMCLGIFCECLCL